MVQQFKKPIYGYVLRLIGPEDDEDVTQDVFLKAIGALPRFRGEASLETWLFRIATNACRDHLRRKRWQRLLFLRKPEDEADPVDAAAAESDPVEESELRSAVRAALRELPARHREIIVLRDVEGFSYEEIAAILGCSAGTVKSRLFYARARLAKRLQQMGFGTDRPQGGDA